MKLRFPRGVHYVTDRRRLGAGSLEVVVERAVAGGVSAVHLREPDLPAPAFFALAERLRAITAGRSALVINDRVEVALEVAAEAVQLGYRSLPVSAARQAAGDRLAIGRSVHGVEEASVAEREGADFLLLGTLYATESHPEATPAGPALVQLARSGLRLPVIGIGGITAVNAAEVMQAGADGVAVIGAIQGAEDVERAAREMVQVVEHGWAVRAAQS